MRALPKAILIGGAVAGVIFGGREALHRYAPPPPQSPSVVPAKAELPKAVPNAAAPHVPSSVPPVAALPALAPREATVGGNAVRMEIWAWNAQTGLIFANGGGATTPESMMAKRGVRLVLRRQDDVPQMQNDLMAFAQEACTGVGSPSGGVHFVVIMGDGSAAFLAALNPQLKRLGDNCRAQIVGTFGYSVGEDKLMGPEEWKRNPQAMLGKTVCGYLRDGDWNIALKFQGDNALPNNPDETSYDPKAVNWIAASDYIDAAQKYVTGYAEERQVKGGNGKRRVQCDGVVTWTPGDVQAAQGRGGLVSIVSTREYRWQMPSVLIGVGPWMETHPAAVEGILDAAYEGADVLKADPAYASAVAWADLPRGSPMRRAMELNTAVFGEQTPDYWLKYFRGVTEPDKTGLMVELGGSTVNNLADAAQLFGLDAGGSPIMHAVYRVFGDIVHQQYPDLVPSYPDAAQVIDTSYVKALLERAERSAVPIPAPERPEFKPVPIKAAVSRKAWQINFDTGKATLRPEGEQAMHELLDQLTVAGGLAVEIHGYTDNTGSPAANQSLAERRAFAIRDWLRVKAPSLFPDDAGDRRLRVAGHGQESPVASNDTEEGRSRNRRVEIVLGRVAS